MHNDCQISQRFRGFFPVIVDVETAGFNPKTDALLEVAAVTLEMDHHGNLMPYRTENFHILPFEGANLEPAALAFNKIDPFHPMRVALAHSESAAMRDLFHFVREEKTRANCAKAVLVGHNATFDLSFVNAAADRCNLKRNPFHPFTVFDTATLSALAYGQTVLTKAAEAAGIHFDNNEAHAARYDAEKTAVLFCQIVNKWKSLGGWPL